MVLDEFRPVDPGAYFNSNHFQLEVYIRERSKGNLEEVYYQGAEFR